MNPYSVEPEFTLVESEKIHLTGKLLASFVQELLELEVDTAVLYKELTRLEGTSGRIRDSLHVLRQSVLEQE